MADCSRTSVVFLHAARKCLALLHFFFSRQLIDSETSTRFLQAVFSCTLSIAEHLIPKFHVSKSHFAFSIRDFDWRPLLPVLQVLFRDGHSLVSGRYCYTTSFSRCFANVCARTSSSLVLVTRPNRWSRPLYILSSNAAFCSNLCTVQFELSKVR